MSDIKKEHLKANEDFFESVFKSLNEGGYYFYPEASCIYQKKDNKFFRISWKFNFLKKYWFKIRFEKDKTCEFYTIKKREQYNTSLIYDLTNLVEKF